MTYRNSRFCRGCSVKKDILRNFVKFTGKHLCQSLFFNKVARWGLQLYYKRGFGTGVFCEFCEISKNTFFYRTPLVAASKASKKNQKLLSSFKLSNELRKHSCSKRQKQSPGCSIKNSVLKNFAKLTGKHLRPSTLKGYSNKPTTLFKKRLQGFSCGFCETFESIFFTKHLQRTASLIAEKRYEQWWFYPSS